MAPVVALESEAVSSTVLIASAEYLPGLQERDGLGGAIAFADTDALRALVAITRRRPEVVAIEREFATTQRGASLIKRIKADPALAACDVRVITHGSDDAPLSPGPAREADAILAAAAPDPTVTEAKPPVVATLDQRGTRRVLRSKIVEGVEAQIDGYKVSLVDLSVLGAQVLSPTILKPNRRVRFTLANDAHPVRCRASVIWASFEIPKGAALYRAGLEFLDASQESVTSFIETNKK